MCFGGEKYEESTAISSGSRVRYSSKRGGRLLSGCFGKDDDTIHERDTLHCHRRRYSIRQAYYPDEYHTRPHQVYVASTFYRGRHLLHGVYARGVGMGCGGGYTAGRAAMPTSSAMQTCCEGQHIQFMAMENYGLPRARHSYIHIPQPGRRGILVHNGQIPNGAAPTGVHPGGISMGMGMGVGMGMNYGQAGYYPGVGAASYGMGYYPGMLGAQIHTRPLYCGPNISHSTYRPGYFNYPSSYYSFPSYSYYSPYANYGAGCGAYANYYYPYQRTYYNPGVAAPAYSYAYQAMAPAVAVPVVQTQTYAVSPQVTVAATASPVTTTYRAGSTSRQDLKEESRILAMRRGAYDPKYIKPADARPDDPFWCRERTGEWHLRSFYQIENECYPGEWLMDPKLGHLAFHRR